MAAILPYAVEMLASESLTELKVRLDVLIKRLYERMSRNVRNKVKYFGLQGVVLKGFELCLAPRSEFDKRVNISSVHRFDLGYNFTADDIPQLLWSDIYERNFKSLIEGSDITDTAARRALSVMLLRLAVPRTWETLAGSLDLPASTGKGIINKLTLIINGFGRSDVFESNLHALARNLTKQDGRVNYGERRRRLKEYSQISEQDWLLIALKSEFFKIPTGARRRNAAAWVWMNLTGGDPHLSPGLQGENYESLREVYRRFMKEDFPSLRIALEQYAQALAVEIDKL